MGVPGLLKWIGNKSKSADSIINEMPRQFNNYFEPFLGSGAVLGTLLHRKEQGDIHFDHAFAADALHELIELFQLVQNDPALVKSYYETESDLIRNDKNYYYDVRERFNEQHNALDFLILLRTCYSGVVRFRKEDGYMSTPVGPHMPMINETFFKRVDLWNRLIRDVQFLAQDFATTMRMAGQGDVVYCDPPYTHSQTIIYGAQTFDINALWDEIEVAKNNGVYVLLSINGSRNSNHTDISVAPPEGLFARDIPVDLGKSMIDRLQQTGNHMENADVTDRLMMTW